MEKEVNWQVCLNMIIFRAHTNDPSLEMKTTMSKMNIHWEGLVADYALQRKD